MQHRRPVSTRRYKLACIIVISIRFSNAFSQELRPRASSECGPAHKDFLWSASPIVIDLSPGTTGPGRGPGEPAGRRIWAGPCPGSALWTSGEAVCSAFTMPFSRYVEIGRVALINYGPEYGKLVVITDVVDQNRVRPPGDVHAL